MDWFDEIKNIKSNQKFKKKVHEVIFEADTSGGKKFDIILIVSILVSVLTVMLDSVSVISQNYDFYLTAVEWLFTFLFTFEYLARIYCVKKPLKYIISFYGVVDFVAIVPTYLSLFFVGTQYLLVVRIFRLLRIFRVFKLANYVGEASILVTALMASRRKITVFLYTVMTLVVVFGSFMYMIEGPENGFTSIPRSIYWAIVTLTTVGYGQVAPQTPFGQFLAAMIMIVGYAIIAVPTGIVTVEMAQSFKQKISTRVCPECSNEGHDVDAAYCKFCGSSLSNDQGGNSDD